MVVMAGFEPATCALSGRRSYRAELHDIGASRLVLLTLAPHNGPDTTLMCSLKLKLNLHCSMYDTTSAAWKTVYLPSKGPAIAGK